MDKSLQLISAIDAAKFLGISTTTLSKWNKCAEGPPRRKIGSRYYYQRESLIRWLEGLPTETKPKTGRTVYSNNAGQYADH